MDFDHEKPMSLTFGGVMIYPGITQQLDCPPLALPPETKADILDRTSSAIKTGSEFAFCVTTPGHTDSVTVRFVPVGRTSGVFRLSQDVDDKPVKVYGWSALLTRLVPGDDSDAIGSLRTAPPLVNIDPSHFDLVADDARPLVATFFVDAESAHRPLVMAVNTAVAGSFFAQFGIGDASGKA